MITIVIARYNENLKWLLNKKFSKYDIIVYNKGINNNYIHLPNMTSINIKNVGRCDHTYLYHIINNYHNLADITIFLPGSCDMYHKMYKTHILFNEIKKNNKAVFLYDNKYDNVELELHNLEFSIYSSSYYKNKLLNPESNLDLALIRPFGNWYKSKFNNIIINHVSYYGIFSVAKNDITQNQLTYYIKLINDLRFSSNPEAGHYIERSWAAVFYPMSETLILPYTNINLYYKLLTCTIVIICILLFILFIIIKIKKF